MNVRAFEKPILAVALAVACWYAVPTVQQWLDVHGDELYRVDYTLYYASARQGLEFGWHRLYDDAAQREVFKEISPKLWWFSNVYTPVMSLIMVPFTRLPLDFGYHLWGALQFLALAFAGVAMTSGSVLKRALLCAMALGPYPVALCIRMGQVIPLQIAALALSFVLLARGRERAAGVSLAVIALKPQAMVLVPFALLIAGKRKAFSAWVVTMVIIGVVVVTLIGWEGASAYARRLAYAGMHPDEFYVGWWYTLPLHVPPVLRPIVEGIAAAVALFAARRHRNRVELAIVAGLIGSLLASPFLHLDDLILLFPAAWLVLQAMPRSWPLLLIGFFLLQQCTVEGTPLWGHVVMVYECVLLVALAVWPTREQLDAAVRMPA